MKEASAEVIANARSAIFKQSESLEGTCASIKGYDFNNGINYSELLKSLVSTGFQASNLGDAIDTVNQMVPTTNSLLLDSSA
ncbi:Deoxyhypusine synthase [Artemisia annua]|uniref:Deoxyhypusine synthase n=1 Tax=Artemisia annua TaxID=35608 RepID=A0A2U1KFH8_ARTAN|nr:Deoxyhypusine synthase [Artemisia annua]